MKALIQPQIILLLFICIRSADLAITSGLAKSYVRAICYGVVALLALIALIVALIAP
jgi:hypothetical protein